jgi:hypothetical protein
VLIIPAFGNTQNVSVEIPLTPKVWPSRSNLNSSRPPVAPHHPAPDLLRGGRNHLVSTRVPQRGGGQLRHQLWHEHELPVRNLREGVDEIGALPVVWRAERHHQRRPGDQLPGGQPAGPANGQRRPGHCGQPAPAGARRGGPARHPGGGGHLPLGQRRQAGGDLG